MRGFKAFAFAATASVLLAGSLQAQTIGQAKWGGTYSGTVSTYRSYRGEQGIFRSPYYAYLDPTNTGTFGRADIFCVDFAHYANTSSNGYSANFTNLGSDLLSLGTTTRNASQTKYLQAAWLADQMVHPMGYSHDLAGGRSTDQLGKMQAAMWKVLSPLSSSALKLSFLASTGWTDPVGYTVGDWWITEALNAVNAGQVNANEWVVVTERGATGGLGAGQEYITQVTPEPATMLLLGTGLVVMLMAAGALRRPVA